MLGWLREPLAENTSIPPGFFSFTSQPITDRDDASPPKHHQQEQQQQQQQQPSLSPLELFRATFEAVALWHRELSSVSSTSRAEPLASAVAMGDGSNAVDGRKPAVTATGVGGKGRTASARDEHEMLPTYPGFPVLSGGVLRLRPLPDRKSFHVTLHRFFAAMVS